MISSLLELTWMTPTTISRVAEDLSETKYSLNTSIALYNLRKVSTIYLWIAFAWTLAIRFIRSRHQSSIDRIDAYFMMRIIYLFSCFVKYISTRYDWISSLIFVFIWHIKFIKKISTWISIFEHADFAGVILIFSSKLSENSFTWEIYANCFKDVYHEMNFISLISGNLIR